MIKPKENKKKPILLVWQSLAIFVVIVILPWALYLKFRSSIKRFSMTYKERDLYHHFNGSNSEAVDSNGIQGSKMKMQTEVNGEEENMSAKEIVANYLPVLGPIPTEGSCIYIYIFIYIYIYTYIYIYIYIYICLILFLY
jgi:hypothetical protein